MANPITDRQLALLCDLAALEDAGLIHEGSDVTVEFIAADHYEVEAPGVLTAKGVFLVAEFHRSGKTIFP